MRLYENRPGGTVDRARRLRREAPAPERRPLRALREAFPDLKWRHHAPIGSFYADILCLSEKLVIQVDGDTHAQRETQDAARAAAMMRVGFRTQRFANTDITRNLDGVITAISFSQREKEGAAQRRKDEGDRARKKGDAA